MVSVGSPSVSEESGDRWISESLASTGCSIGIGDMVSANLDRKSEERV